MDKRAFAKALRSDMTDAERRLWFHLRAHRFLGAKFRRQQPIGPYVVDFVHFASRVIVEADGGGHAGSTRDGARDAWLGGKGFTVMRFWNDDILLRTDEVLAEIVLAIEREDVRADHAGRRVGTTTSPHGAHPSAAHTSVES
ncbi:endonuclease domain-containing protein [Dokdonella sp. MW10]|uniref:endonuclease domain-containing protein n=1 Tax=Dokdonella sp. MW10 TaxID=2992926 RepID=UPI003F8119AE